MISNLKGYVPTDIEFIIEDSVKEKFPTELDFSEVKEDLTNAADIIKFVGKEFVATFPDNEYVERKLDEHEIQEIREEYCIKQENIVPQRKRNLEETLEMIKSMKKAAEEAYNGALQEVAEYAAQVKKGTKEMRLSSMETFCISLNGYYLTYTYNKETGKFVLAKGYKIPEGQARELWSNDEKNRESMRDYFGIDFPAEEKPEEE